MNKNKIRWIKNQKRALKIEYNKKCIRDSQNNLINNKYIIMNILNKKYILKYPMFGLLAYESF